MLGVGASEKTYQDEVFNTYLYKGDGANNRAITGTGVNLNENGGLVWIKSRTDSENNTLVDSAQGVNKVIQSNTTSAAVTQTNRVSAFGTDGFTLGTTADWGTNRSGAYYYSSWSFRKSPGFFDCKTFTWSGGYSTLSVNHDLKSVPGMVMIKGTNGQDNWKVYHRDLGTGDNKMLALNTTDAAHGMNTSPNNNHFVSVTDTAVTFRGLANTRSYVMYVFAGGDSNASEARSVEFDGSDDGLAVANSSDFSFGSGDFTVEGWAQIDQNSSQNALIGMWRYQNGRRSWTIQTDNSTRQLEFYVNSGGGTATNHGTSGGNIPVGHWFHFAGVRHGNTIKLFVNGEKVAETAYTSSLYNNTLDPLYIGNQSNGTDFTNGRISNIRITKGQALYTTSFKVPTEPLTTTSQGATASNVKLLCCNNSSATGSTVTPTTITTGPDGNSNPTALTDSPFDDPAGFVFGDSKEGIIKTGSYVGNGSDTVDIDVYLGWEPTWLLVKQTVNSGNWQLVDSATSWPVAGNWETLRPNLNQAANDSTETGIQLTPTGFKVVKNWGNFNTNGDTHVFMAIRRSDGYVGKSRTATELFAIDTGNGSTAGPTFDSGFPVDWALRKDSVASGGSDWVSYQRLLGLGYLRTNTNDATTNSARAKWDFMTGINHTDSSTTYAWMWKRHAGFDVVAYEGNGIAGRGVPHSLSKTPEMVFVKKRSSTSDSSWSVYHKGLNGGVDPEDYYINLNGNSAEVNNLYRWNDTPHSSTLFTLGTSGSVNDSGQTYIAMLFASTDVSKVGSYTGDDSDDGSHVIDVGFTPRFLIIKRADGSADWKVFDTTNGFPTSGTANYLELNTTDARYAGSGVTVTKDTNGFKLWSPGGPYNANNAKYIYYAHA